VADSVDFYKLVCIAVFMSFFHSRIRFQETSF